MTSTSDSTLIEHIVSMRRRVCPRTSYATSGAAASVAYVLTRSDRVLSTQFLCKGLKNSGEFDTVHVMDDLGELAKSLNGNVIILYGAVTADMLPTLLSLFEQSKSKLAVLVWFEGETVTVGDPSLERFDKQEHHCDKYHIASCYNYKKLVADNSLGFNRQPSVQSKSQYKYLWSSSNPNVEQGKERVLQRLADKTLFGSGNVKLTVQQWDGLVNQCIARNIDDYGIYDMIRQKVLGSTLAEDLQKSAEGKLGAESVAKVEAEEDGRANHMVSRTVESIPPRLRQGGNLSRMLDYGCAEGAITAGLGKHLSLSPDRILGADVRTIPSLGFTFIPLAAEEPSPPPLGAILPSIETGSVDLITSAMVFHHVTHIKAVLLELRRVVSARGALVIREHHCVSADMGAFLDITHGLYSLSWSSPVEWPDFITEYKAFYRSREEWDALLQESGFTLCVEECGHQALSNYRAAEWATRKPNGFFPNVIKAYYAVYKPNPSFRLPVPAPAAVQTKAVAPVATSGVTSSTASGEVGLKRSAGESSIQSAVVATSSREDPAGKRARLEAPASSAVPAAPVEGELHESKKYPGKFYRINKLTGATEWI